MAALASRRNRAFALGALVMAVLLLFAPVAGALADEEDVNYCHDSEVNAKWDRILAGARRDPLVVRLYGLRLGLCSMIERGLVDFDQATRIFEEERAKSLIRRHKEASGKSRGLAL